MDPVPRTVLNLALETLINKVLALDPISSPRLAPWRGQCLTLAMTPPGVAFSLLIEDGSVRVLAEQEAQTDAGVSGTPLEMLHFLAPHSAQDSAMANVEISGNRELADSFRSLLRDLEPDWEGELAKYLGDMLAHEAGRRLRQGIRWGRDAGGSLLADAEEYLTEEARLVPSQSEVSHRMQDLPPLEQALDDLDRRIDRLERILRSRDQKQSP